MPLARRFATCLRRDASGERQFGGFAGAAGVVGPGAAAFADQALDATALSAALGCLLVAARWLLVGTIPLASPAAASALQQAALLKCAREEAEWLFGTADPRAVSAALPQRPAVLVSDGAAPLRWWLGGVAGELPAFRVPVVDSTGAGDVFTAGLLHGFVAHGQWPVLQRMRFASACGALVCQGPGAIDPQPMPDQVAAFLEQH